MLAVASTFVPVIIPVASFTLHQHPISTMSSTQHSDRQHSVRYVVRSVRGAAHSARDKTHSARDTAHSVTDTVHSVKHTQYTVSETRSTQCQRRSTQHTSAQRCIQCAKLLQVEITQLLTSSGLCHSPSPVSCHSACSCHSGCPCQLACSLHPFSSTRHTTKSTTRAHAIYEHTQQASQSAGRSRYSSGSCWQSPCGCAGSSCQSSAASATGGGLISGCWNSGLSSLTD